MMVKGDGGEKEHRGNPTLEHDKHSMVEEGKHSMVEEGKRLMVGDDKDLMLMDDNHSTSKDFLTTCLEILKNAIDSVDPFRLVLEHISLEKDNVMMIKGESFNLGEFRKVHVLGVGKGTPFLYHGLREVLGEWITGGVIVSLEDHRFSDGLVEFAAGSHPIPDGNSVRSGERVVDYIWKHIQKDDMVLFLVTGGASALMEIPSADLKIEALAAANELLLRSGLDIHEINTFRKRLSAAKGGKLAGMIHPALIITLALSDVPNALIGDIGSGPTIQGGGKTVKITCMNEENGLTSGLDRRILKYFDEEQIEVMNGTEGTDDFSFDRSFILGDISLALEYAKDWAEELGIETTIWTKNDSGDVRVMAKDVAERIDDWATKGMPASSGSDREKLFLSGGELTVKVGGKGRGGRNQEFILALMIELKDTMTRYFVASVGTDGIDGPTDAAGAWADEKTYEKAMILGLDPEAYLANNDSYTFFKALDQLIVTGPTRTNVMDIRMVYLPLWRGGKPIEG